MRVLSLFPVSSPKPCAVSSAEVLGAEPGQEEEPIVVVALGPGQRPFSQLPSVDSAVESWDGSNMDSVFNNAGMRLHTHHLEPTVDPISSDLHVCVCRLPVLHFQ